MKQIITIFLLLSMLQIHAQIELSMIGAIEKALETNYDIRIQQMDSQIASGPPGMVLHHH